MSKRKEGSLAAKGNAEVFVGVNHITSGEWITSFLGRTRLPKDYLDFIDRLPSSLR
jgi:hypothetical protein